MAVLGAIIKGVIELKDKLTPESNPIEEQENLLKNILEKAKDTAFGQYYNFDKLIDAPNTSKLFSSSIPFFDYNKINDEWWSKLHEGKENVTWPGTPDYYALSSGTTGKTSKRIPVTDAMISAIKSTGIDQVSALSNFDLPADFFEKGILMLGSSTDLTEKNDHLEGEISGISASNIPFWFRDYYKPGEEIAQIEDWDERVQKISDNAKNWDIGALSGIPSWIELMLEKVIADHNLNNIHEIWPNLQVYTSGGVAFAPYKKSFNALLAHPITVIDTYLASEGFVAFQARPETDAMKLATNSGIYFEFVPFKPEYINQDGSLTDDAPALTLSEVEKDQDYALVISTVSGAWRYLIGDTIEFTDLERAEIKITGRTKFFLNTVGSQLSVNKLDDALNHIEEVFNVKISEYTLCAKRFDEDFYHSWYLGTEDELDTKKVIAALDEHLKEANKNYKVARSKALKGVKVTIVSPNVFHEWNGANKKKGGQVKMERVMGEEKFEEWEKFTNNI
ncbi:GH3 auxin-responsive promoter family protein [Cellulophaga sp. HaHaR_3_176]|uniref:GH3 family domain-containing protein n=1 Tax=Cellulophaga sp. HaHaR_3_176 TaxID=1942464 RepID=UPI001C1F5C78|nr:GH3 auxin-responsive promoter family protein [Cellulophaga sp. HaHaR_3_176]QWX83855.1 GH3 auxin-responsive promoter family protein [Cellulophaga sp. HaHaR_3_176]